MSNLSNSTEDDQVCQDLNNYQLKYIHGFLIPAVVIILILSFLGKRKTLKPNVCSGRPALVRPLGFLDEPENRWGIMFVFGSVTGIILVTAFRTFSLDFPVWANIFLVYLLCLEMSVICYPLFACMTYRLKLIGSIIGLLYSSGWFCFELYFCIQNIRCIVEYSYTVLKEDATAFFLLGEMPVLVCHFLVVLKFSWKLVKCLKKGLYKNEVINLCGTHNLTYVRNLLRKRRTNENNDIERLNLMQKIYRKFTQNVSGFRFPISVMISAFMSGVMLFLISLACNELVSILLDKTVNSYLADVPISKFSYYGIIIVASGDIALITAIVSGLRNIYLFLMNYKKDMLLLYKGDRRFIPSTVLTPSPNVYMADGMRFIGTSITGMIWGTLLCYLLVFVPLSLMMVVIRILIVTGKFNNIWKQFEWLVYPMCMIVIFKVQTFLIGRFFVQPKIHDYDRYRPLAVNNRNAYDIFSFFMIFLNASVGIIIFMKRILAGTFLGVFLIPRMDHCLLMRGYESMDQCYVNYIGMLMVDVTHNHPVMRVFCSLLTAVLEKSQECKPLVSAVENPDFESIGSVQSPSLNRCTNSPLEIGNNMSRRRWLLAYTLIRNPGLVPARRRGLSENSNLNLDDIQCMERDAVEDDKYDESWRFSLRCFKNYKCTIPSNIILNLMALIVLISILFVYVGVQAMLA